MVGQQHNHIWVPGRTHHIKAYPYSDDLMFQLL